MILPPSPQDNETPGGDHKVGERSRLGSQCVKLEEESISTKERFHEKDEKTESAVHTALL